MSTDSLAGAIMGDTSVPAAMTPELRRGVVTGISPLMVRVGAATSSAPSSALGSYQPAVGDVVSVLVLEGDRLVLGEAGLGAHSGARVLIAAGAVGLASPVGVPVGGANGNGFVLILQVPLTLEVGDVVTLDFTGRLTLAAAAGYYRPAARCYLPDSSFVDYDIGDTYVNPGTYDHPAVFPVQPYVATVAGDHVFQFIAATAFSSGTFTMSTNSTTMRYRLERLIGVR